MNDLRDAYRDLAVAILRQAVQDALEPGGSEARSFLFSADCASLLSALGVNPRTFRRRLVRLLPKAQGIDREWVSIREASRMTGYNPEYLRQLVRRGRVKASRGTSWTYRIQLESLYAHMKQYR